MQTEPSEDFQPLTGIVDADSIETEVEIASAALNLTADAFSWEAHSDYESDCDDDNINMYYNFASSWRENHIDFQFSDKILCTTEYRKLYLRDFKIQDFLPDPQEGQVVQAIYIPHIIHLPVYIYVTWP